MLWFIMTFIGAIIGVIISVLNHTDFAEGFMITVLVALCGCLLAFLIALPLSESETISVQAIEYDLYPMVDNIYLLRSDDNYEFLVLEENGIYRGDKCHKSDMNIGYTENLNYAKVRVSKQEYKFPLIKFLIGNFSLSDKYFFVLPLGSHPIDFGG